MAQMTQPQLYIGRLKALESGCPCEMCWDGHPTSWIQLPNLDSLHMNTRYNASWCGHRGVSSPRQLP